MRAIPVSVRHLATRPPRSCDWYEIPTQEREAWEALGWNVDSWSGNKAAPLSSLQTWDELSQMNQAAAAHGLQYTPDEWNAHIDDLAVTNTVLAPPDDKNTGASTAPPATVGNSSNTGGLSLTQPKRLVTAVATSLLKQLPSMFNALSAVEGQAPPVVVDGLETTLYLDDSASMEENGPYGPRSRPHYLDEGKKVLTALAPLIAGPTRVIKFGNTPTLLHLRDESLGPDDAALVPHASNSGGPPGWVADSMWGLGSLLKRWDATSLSTYMWHMIEQDVLSRYRPGRGTLRLIVITDGQDVQSPVAYRGIRGMDPMQKTLLDSGYDIEWHIVVLGKGQWGTYAALAGATGGSYVQIDQFHRDHPDVRSLLAAIAGNADASARHSRQQQYQLEATRGEAEEVPWFRALPPPDQK